MAEPQVAGGQHLNLLNLFVTDKLKKGEVQFAFCPIHDMHADFLQNLYREFYTYPAWSHKWSHAEECVGKKEFHRYGCERKINYGG